MKKFALLSVLLTLAAALFFAACYKEEATPKNGDAAFSNPQNPFDDVGKRHNECLDILQKKYAGKRHSFEEAFQTLSENGRGAAKCDPGLIHDFALILNTKDPIKVLTDKMFREGRISEALHKAYGELDQIVINQMFSTQLAQSVRVFESKIPGFALDAQEEQRLYSTCSVARYSNAYWTARKVGVLGQRDREDFTEFCDIVATLGGASGDDAALFSSMAELWLFFGLSAYQPTNSNNPDDIPMKLPDLSWLFGQRLTLEEPCNHACHSICSFSTNAGHVDDSSMSGQALAITPEIVILDMDGSALGADFYEIFDSGRYDLNFDFQVPDNIVTEIFRAGNFAPPASTTIFRNGTYEVSAQESGYCIILPVTYEDGSTTTWYVNIHR